MAKKKRKTGRLSQIIQREADLVLRIGEDAQGEYMDIYSRDSSIAFEERSLTEREWASLKYERNFRERADCEKKFICPYIGSNAAFCSTRGFSECPRYSELPNPDPNESVYVTILRRREKSLRPQNPPAQDYKDETFEV